MDKRKRSKNELSGISIYVKLIFYSALKGDITHSFTQSRVNLYRVVLHPSYPS